MENKRFFTATDGFMKQFVIDGMNLLEKFMDWIGEKVRDVGRGRRCKI